MILSSPNKPWGLVTSFNVYLKEGGVLLEALLAWQKE